MPRSRPSNPVPPRRPGKPSLQARLDIHGFILLYDGTCGLCNRAVNWVLRRDPGGPMRFAPLASPLGREALAMLPALADIDSVVLLHPGGAWLRSTAALELARYVGGPWRLALLGYLVPRPIRDWMYDQVARRRTRFFGRTESCPLPAPEVRERYFME